jgi:hypothetical protein
MEPIKKKFKRGIRDILYSTYFGDRIRYQEEGVAVEKDILALVTDYNSITTGDGFIAEVPLPIQSAKMFGLDPITKRRIEVDDELTPLGLEEIIEDTFRQLIDDLIFDAHAGKSDSNALLALGVLKSELKRFKVLVLEEQPQYRERIYPMFWGKYTTASTCNVLAKHLELTDSWVSDTGTAHCPEIVIATMSALSRVIPNALERILKLETVIDGDSNEEVINNNGVFYYLGQRQSVSIENFLLNNNLVPTDQVNNWVNLLSGQSLPAHPLQWNGVRTHFILLLKHVVHRRKKGQASPIELYGSQPSWTKLMKHIILKDGEPLGPNHVCRDYEILKNGLTNKAKYIAEFFESYQGEG